MEKHSSGSIIIPVYNGVDCLAELVERLGAALPELFAQFEVILVNDGSPDASWDCIEQLSEQYAWVRGVNLRRNYGQHNATLCGIRMARYAITVTLDDDLQHPPEEIGILIEKLDEGFDVVYGFPKKLPHSLWRNLFSVFSKWFLSKVMGIQTIRNIGSFRAFRTDLRQAFENYQNPNVLVDVLLSWGTSRFAVVTVNEAPRQTGSSNYNLSKLVKAGMLILTGFSTIPLRFTSLVGFGFTLFGIFILIYVLYVALVQGSVPGFPFLASLIALFSGVQLFALGIIGEYLARIFDRSMERPPYVVGQVIGQTTTGEPAAAAEEQG
jgi:undecaprenyl-phosphate 4-deoxy-4-formamido-L-arabinose transferase